MAISPQLLAAILDSLTEPVMFVDGEHIIRYMNRAAAGHYRGGADLLGRSIFACHNEDSNRIIREFWHAMQAEGLEERLITDNRRHRVYMRAVRGPAGQLLGYFERFEPPGGPVE